MADGCGLLAIQRGIDTRGSNRNESNTVINEASIQPSLDEVRDLNRLVVIQVRSGQRGDYWRSQGRDPWSSIMSDAALSPRAGHPLDFKRAEGCHLAHEELQGGLLHVSSGGAWRQSRGVKLDKAFL